MGSALSARESHQVSAVRQAFTHAYDSDEIHREAGNMAACTAKSLNLGHRPAILMLRPDRAVP